MTRTNPVLAIIGILPLIVCVAHATDGALCIEQSVVARFDPGRTIGHVAADNHRGYAAENSVGVHILDLTNPIDPQPLGFWPQTRSIQALAANNQTLFVANNFTGIEVIDASDPANPQLISTITVSGITSDIVIHGTTLAILNSGTLRLYDISDPSTPTPLGTYATGSVTGGLDIDNNIAYATASHNGLYIIDINDQAAPALMKRQDTPDFATDVVVRDDIAFVTVDDAGMQAYDISNPANPILLSQTDTPGTARALLINDTTAYIADSAGGIHALDIADPANPSSLGLLSSLQGAYAEIAFDSEYMITASNTLGLEIINPNAIINPLLSRTPISGQPHRSTMVNNTLYIASGDQGLAIYDISDRSHPLLMSTIDTPGTAVDVMIATATALVADSLGGLQLIDVADPANPALISTYQTQGLVRGVQTYFGLAYLATEEGLEIINFTSPANPFRVAFLPLPKAYKVALGPGLVYVACDDLGLHTVNVINPSNPFVVSQYNEPNYNARNLVVGSNRLFVSNFHNDNNGWLEFFDLSNPSKPTVTEIIGYGCDGSFYSDARLYTIQRNQLSIHDPFTQPDPTPLVNLPLYDRAEHVSVLNNTAVVVSIESATMSIYDVGGCVCAADFNADGNLNADDVNLFLIAYFSQSPEADLNNDNTFNFYDISAFLASYLSGCQ